jgi:adenosylhomocysteine nucleosidase
MLPTVKVNMTVELNKSEYYFVVIISADAEWKVVKKNFSGHPCYQSPFGEWFVHQYDEIAGLQKPVVFMHSGWGKVSSASGVQFAIDHWTPKLIVNLGTCGGFFGKIKVGDIVLVESTVIYDIYEKMGDPDEHLNYYTSQIDNSWIKEPLPLPVVRTLLVSADRDLFCDEILPLHQKFGAIAGDWESGALAWVAQKNQVPCLILRGVTDLVSPQRGEAYDGNDATFYNNTEVVMDRLLKSLPMWLKAYIGYLHQQSLE